jgi:hypothetical protein
MSFRDLGKLKHKLGPGAGMQLESLAALPRLSPTADRSPRPYFREHTNLNKPQECKCRVVAEVHFSRSWPMVVSSGRPGPLELCKMTTTSCGVERGNVDLVAIRIWGP